MYSIVCRSNSRMAGSGGMVAHQCREKQRVADVEAGDGNPITKHSWKSSASQRDKSKPPTSSFSEIGMVAHQCREKQRVADVEAGAGNPITKHSWKSSASQRDKSKPPTSSFSVD